MEPLEQTDPGAGGHARAAAWIFGLGGLLAAAFLVALSVTFADADLWGHLRFGLDIVRDGRLHEIDPYSYATGAQDWINHEWLAEVLFALAWSAGGATGLIALKGCVALSTVALLYAHLAHLRIEPVRATIFLVLLCMPMILAYFGQIRPQIFTYFLFALLLAVLQRAAEGRYTWLWVTPPLLALWVNLHGGVLAGLGLFALWSLFRLCADWPSRWRIASPALLGAAATLINPYGPELLVFLLSTATVPRPEIADWKPLTLMSPFGALYLVTLATMTAGLVLTRRPRQPATLVLCGLMTLLPLVANRHLPLFCLAALILAGEHVNSAWNRVISQGPPAKVHLPRQAAVLPILGGIGLLIAATHQGIFSRIRLPGEFLPPASIDLLARSGVSGNLSIDFDWGEYAIWHLAPKIKVGMDGRRETVYPPAIYEEYLDFHLGRRDWEAPLRRHGADMALVKKDSALHNLLKLHPAWQAVFEDARSALFVRRGAPQAEPLQRLAAAFEPPPPKNSFP